MRRVVATVVVSLASLGLSGCMLEFGVAPGGASQITGAVIGTPVNGTFILEPLLSAPPPCGLSVFGETIAFDVTIRNSTGSVSTRDCPTTSGTSGAGMFFRGWYFIEGGSGAYAGATGLGTFTLAPFGPHDIGITEIGTFNVPGSASVGAVRTKRTFKTRATIGRIRIRIRMRCGARDCTGNSEAQLVAQLRKLFQRREF